jgi:hypothetical protein
MRKMILQSNDENERDKGKEKMIDHKTTIWYFIYII